MKRGLLILGLLLTSFTTMWGQDVLRQKVDLELSNATFEEVLLQLIEQEGARLSFRNEILPEGRFSFSYQQQPLQAVLEDILRGTNLIYRTIGEQVIIVPAPLEEIDEYHTISGFITDADTGESLIGANIIDLYSQQGTVSNEYGFFSLNLAKGWVDMRVSYLGYESAELSINLTENELFKLPLKGSVTLNEIIVYPRDTSANPIGGLARGELIGLRETQLLPSLAGEPDVIRTALLLPGVTSGADGAEGMQVRGGDAGQNLVLLDGVPVYYVNHGIGLFSIFNTNIVRSAQLFRAGFPARYGGRLSSVLDIRTKEGNLQRLSGNAEAGLLSTRFTLEGPLVKDKSSFLVSGRWSFVHLLLEEQSRRYKQQRGRDGSTDYRFYDLNAKFNYSFSTRDRIFLSLYRGRDTYDDLTESTNMITTGEGDDLQMFELNQSYGEGLNWVNTVGSLRWNHLFSDQLFANFSLTYSRLDQESFYNLEDELVNLTVERTDSVQLQGLFKSGIEDLGLKADWQLILSPRQQFRFGLGANRRIFNPGALIVDEPFAGEDAFQNNTINTTELSAYLEGQGKLGSNWEWNAGLHGTWWYVRDTGHPSLQPRVSLSYEPTSRWSFSASASRMVQNLHFLRNTTVNLPTEIWVPSTDQIEPAEAWMGNLGYRYEINSAWDVKMDIYYKKMNRILAFLEGTEGFEDWEENVASGIGESYGAEWQLRKREGRLTGWVSYTLSKATRQFDELNLGRVYPYRYDRRHNLQMAAIFKLSPTVHLSATWGYASGFAITLPLVKFTSLIPGQVIPPEGLPEVLDPERKNNVRMPDYHRLDLNLHFEWQNEGRLKHHLNVGVYNAYNRNNPLYYDIRRFLVNQQDVLFASYQFVEVQLAPILPILSYKVSF
ncbi:MAG: TonB-dependent receptor [Bacteroidota bacterium]